MKSVKTGFQICCHSSASYCGSAFPNWRCQGLSSRPIASRCTGQYQQREKEHVLPIGITETRGKSSLHKSTSISPLYLFLHCHTSNFFFSGCWQKKWHFACAVSYQHNRTSFFCLIHGKRCPNSYWRAPDLMNRIQWNQLWSDIFTIWKI